MKNILKGFITGFGLVCFGIGIGAAITFVIYLFTTIGTLAPWNAISTFIGAVVILATSIFLIGFMGCVDNENKEDAEILMYMLQHYPDNYTKLYEEYATNEVVKKVKK